MLTAIGTDGGQGTWPEDRRRRLRHQAVQHAGTDGPGRGAAPPRAQQALAARAPSPVRVGSRRSPRHGGHTRRRAGEPLRTGVPAPSLLPRASGQDAVPRRAVDAGVGLQRSRRLRGPWTFTSQACGRSSKTSRGSRSFFSRFRASVTSSSLSRSQMKLHLKARALPAAVVVTTVVVIMLAALQYRWSTEVSEATGVRLADTLQLSMINWHLDFLRNFAEVCLTMRVDPEQGAIGDLTSVRRRVAEWKAVARYPDLVAACVPDDGRRIRAPSGSPLECLQPGIRTSRVACDASSRGRTLFQAGVGGCGGSGVQHLHGRRRSGLALRTRAAGPAPPAQGRIGSSSR